MLHRSLLEKQHSSRKYEKHIQQPHSPANAVALGGDVKAISVLSDSGCGCCWRDPVSSDKCAQAQIGMVY